MNTDMTNLYRSRGMIPNRYWYQLNGQSAQANWLEQREAIYSRIQEQEEELVPQIIFTSEVKIRGGLTQTANARRKRSGSNP